MMASMVNSIWRWFLIMDISDVQKKKVSVLNHYALFSLQNGDHSLGQVALSPRIIASMTDCGVGFDNTFKKSEYPISGTIVISPL